MMPKCVLNSLSQYLTLMPLCLPCIPANINLEYWKLKLMRKGKCYHSSLTIKVEFQPIGKYIAWWDIKL